jgi:hypothetical protein
MFTAAEINRGDWLPLTDGLDFVLTLSGVFLRERGDASILMPPPISIVARKNSASAPFERITWNEFRQCELHCVDNNIYPSDNDMTPMTATGPGGLKLFSIHVALGLDRPLPPGLERTEELAASPREKCQRWLQRLMTEYPDRSPECLPKLAEEAQQMFPKLSERAFYDCLSSVQQQTGNRNWSKGGRRPKPPHKSPHKK